MKTDSQSRWTAQWPKNTIIMTFDFSIDIGKIQDKHNI